MWLAQGTHLSRAQKGPLLVLVKGHILLACSGKEAMKVENTAKSVFS